MEVLESVDTGAGVTLTVKCFDCTAEQQLVNGTCVAEESMYTFGKE